MYAPCFSRPDRLALAVALALGGTAVQATNFTVTVGDDNGLGDTAGTLSKAILDANGAGGANTITLNTDVTITGVMKRLINSDITLQSDGTTRTIKGCANPATATCYRPLFVKSGTVTIRNLNLANGKALGGAGSHGGGGAGLGGALFVYSGTVTVENVSFTGNVAKGGTGSGVGGKGGGGMLGTSNNGGGGLFGGGTTQHDGGYGGTGAYGGRGGTSANKAGGFGGGAGSFGGGGGYGVGISGGNGGFGGGGYGFANNGGGGGFGGGGGGTDSGAVGAGGFGGGTSIDLGGGAGAGLGGAIFVKQGALSLKGVSFSGNSATGGTGGNNGQGKGGAVFICTSDLDSDSTAAGAKGGCSGRIDIGNTFGVSYSNNTAADGSPDLFWTQQVPCGGGVGLPTGQWQMLAAPCVPAGVGTVASTFGNSATDKVNLEANQYAIKWLMYSVNPAANAYVAESSANLLAPGTGYWIKTLAAAANDQLVVLNGTATPTTVLAADGCASANGCTAVTVSTVSGASRYNLVGNPFPYNVDWAQVRVRINGGTTTYTPSQAAGVATGAAASGNVSPPVLAKEIWIWTGTGYDTYDDTVGATLGNLRYFQSFWVKVLPGAAGQTVELLIPAEQTTHAQAVPGRPWYQGVLDWLLPPAAAATLPAAPAPAPDWYVRLKVDNPATGWKDHNTVIGQRQRALAGYDPTDLVELAPFAAPYLTMVLPHPEWGAKAGDYVSDFRPADGKPTAWTLEVRADPVGSQVVLHWAGDPAALARSELIDSQTGRTIVPTDPNYTDGYPVTLTGKTRPFVWRYLGQ